MLSLYKSIPGMRTPLYTGHFNQVPKVSTIEEFHCTLVLVWLYSPTIAISMHGCTHLQGLCGEGKGGEMVDNGDNTYGGKYVVNPR